MAAVADRIDVVERKVAVAVEIIDPVTQQRVAQGVTVTLGGRADKPFVSASRRFVWLKDPDTWPPTISVDPGKLPFQAISNLPLPVQPAGWPNVPPEMRRLRITLTPTSVYPFDEGVTAVSGFLFEKNAQQPHLRDPIVGADVSMEWAVNAQGLPAPPPAVQTDARGEFSLFARIPNVTGHVPDVVRGMLKVRLVVTHVLTTRKTPVNFRFMDPPLLSSSPPYLPVSDGRIVSGAVSGAGVALDWAALV
jgi:hypothetical protein